MNLLEVKVINSQIMWRDKTIPLDKKNRRWRVSFRIPWKDVEINPNGEIKGEIYFIDGTPADISKVLHVQLEDNSSIKIEIKSGEIYRCGEKIAFSLPKKIYLFKKNSGERIL